MAQTNTWTKLHNEEENDRIGTNKDVSESDTSGDSNERTPLHQKVETEEEDIEPGNNGSKERVGLRFFPLKVFLILGMEFCERFSFYGMRAVLYLYFVQEFKLEESEAMLFYHLFVMLAYCTPIFGGILADNYIGKFKTIFYLSIIYTCGSILLSVSSAPNLATSPPNPVGTIFALILIAIGTGGIKPCVSSFGAEQIQSTSNIQLQLFFSLFYFSINMGSVLSTFLTPIFRETPCFGSENCFPLAFGVPAILMIVATTVFICGRPTYTFLQPTKNIFVKVLSSIFKGLYLSIKRIGKKDVPSFPHWMDHTKEFYGDEFVEDVKQFLSILTVLLPAPFFWALFDQTASKWVQQATEMQSQIGSIYIPPDMMQVCNSLFVLMLIPLFEKVFYPLMRKIAPMRSLQRMGVGLIFTIISFVIAGLLQLKINTGEFVTPEDSDDCVKCCVSGCVPILYQIPQYLILTMGEVMFSITGLEFAFQQAPKSMRSVCSAYWLLTVAFGNLIVILISGSDLFSNRSYEFFFYSGLLLLVFFIFLFLSHRYKYNNH